MAKAHSATILLACFAAAASAAPTKASGHIKSGTYAGVVNYGTKITGASADITVPECRVGTPNTTYSTYTSDGWVGISAYRGPDDAASYGLLQTGISCFIEPNFNPETGEYLPATTSYQAWTEWAPGPPIYFNSSLGDFQPGDRIHGRVHAVGRDAGTTYLKNSRTGKEYAYEFINQTALLGSTNAEWITECETGYTPEFGAEGTLTANYTAWHFENAAYYLESDAKSHLARPDSQIDTYINGTEVAKTVYHAAGRFQVDDAWPANFTLGL